MTPNSKHAALICGSIKGLAMCAQFHVKRMSMPLAAARPMCRASSAAFWGNTMAESSASARASASSVIPRTGRSTRNALRSEAAVGSPAVAGLVRPPAARPRPAVGTRTVPGSPSRMRRVAACHLERRATLGEGGPWPVWRAELNRNSNCSLLLSYRAGLKRSATFSQEDAASNLPCATIGTVL